MPLSYYESLLPISQRLKIRKQREAEKKRKHADILRAWKAGEISWNEYIRMEKKYRT